MSLTTGIDVGASSVKVAVYNEDTGKFLTLERERIHRRSQEQVVSEAYNHALETAGAKPKDVTYIATTGDAEGVEFRTGHFYSMTTHARGALYLDPEARVVVDMGALHGRAMRMDGRSRVVNYTMTSQCASGLGQFLENIARYLGVSLDEVGDLSNKALKPEIVSSICAVLAETDVINMVSRGIPTADILKGIHQSMAGRFVKLLRSVKAEGVLVVTGGLARDDGMKKTMEEELAKLKVPVTVRTFPESIYAGAMGAALWGAFRQKKLSQRQSGGKQSEVAIAAM